MLDQPDTNELLAADLLTLARLLEDNGLVDDVRSLYDASNRVRLSRDENWAYECVNLKFKTIEEKMGGAIPNNINFFTLIFSININGKYTDDSTYYNPLNSLDVFDIEISAYDEDLKELYASWHLDKHISSGNDGIPQFIHPEYHIAFGGNLMEGKMATYEGLVVLPAPRISHPPMDVVLGIDFIVQNYFRLEDKRKLIEDSNYKEIIKRSQKRLWRPYFASINCEWHNPPEGVKIDEEFNNKQVFPFFT
ncbi:hypothetical protein [Allomuricauda sp. NBRC 101325]|uniref:hypothetical protein n=1 Tax=Allomuricauda sp. NBRC 101325 TaxID=1113758 RepID=UPI0024A1251C|nr:hypothetical protein [Muricauda sp. NBRC 101325]GLU45404.1 hypothetical protein Musp01_30280 [Muricauda sp. NBRC 101325]